MYPRLLASLIAGVFAVTTVTGTTTTAAAATRHTSAHTRQQARHIQQVHARRQSAAVPAGPMFGAQFHGVWSSYTNRERNMVLSTMATNGVKTVRIDIGWASLQPDGPHSYDPWAVNQADTVIDEAVAHGLSPIVTLWMTPSWANDGAGELAPPAHPADYARVARWAAARWAGKVAAWEVWNEPNDPGFFAGANPSRYAKLLKAAYPAFHAGDPNTQVVFGGTEYVDTDWISKVLAAGALHSFDVMAVHPYMGISDQPPTTPNDGTEYTMLHTQTLHRMLNRAGRPHTPIWFTEFGWSHTKTPADAPNWARGVSAHEQADYLVQTLRLVKNRMPYVSRVFWYDDLVGISSGFLSGYGLVNPNGTPTLALRAARTAA